MPLPLACCPGREHLPSPSPPPSPAPPRGSLARFLRSTRLPGLRYLSWRPPSRARRLLWALAVLACLGLLCTWCSDRVRYLQGHPVHTRAHLAYALRRRFPAVTLCNNNPVRFPRLTRPDLYSVGQWLGLARPDRSLVPALLEALPEPRRRWLGRLANYSRFLPPRPSERTMESFFHRLGHQIEDMLLACRFRRQPCGPEHFAPVSCRAPSGTGAGAGSAPARGARGLVPFSAAHGPGETPRVLGGSGVLVPGLGAVGISPGL